MVIGLVSGGCAMAIGWVGGEALVQASSRDPDLSAIQALALRRMIPLEQAGVGAIAVAGLILVLG